VPLALVGEILMWVVDRRALQEAAIPPFADARVRADHAFRRSLGSRSASVSLTLAYSEKLTLIDALTASF
jgi:hypothetical protein